MLRWVLGAIGGAAAAAGAKRAIRYAHDAQTQEDEVVFGRCHDGWRLALARYRPHPPSSGQGEGIVRALPLLLVPGLGANRFSFDLRADVSLALAFRRLGFDVFTVELRGSGHSDKPGLLSDRRYGWTFDDHVMRDLPTAVEAIRRATGAERVHAIGHSMGGVLLLSHLARGGSEDLASVCTIGASLDYGDTGSSFGPLTRLKRLCDVVPAIPLGTLSAWYSVASGGDTPMDRFQVWPENTDPSLKRRLDAVAFETISTGVLKQLATILEPGGLRSADGRTRYNVGLGQASTPVLAIAGDEDRQCSPEAAGRVLTALPEGLGRLEVFGRPTHDTSYGHFDLLMGKRVEQEVVPLIGAWLDEHDDKARTPSQRTAA